MNTLQLAIQAQNKLRSTQINWQEQCLFDCDGLLTQLIQREKNTDWQAIAQAFFEAAEGYHSVRDCEAEGRKDCEMCKAVKEYEAAIGPEAVWKHNCRNAEPCKQCHHPTCDNYPRE